MASNRLRLTDGHTLYGLKPGKDYVMNDLTYTRVGDYEIPNLWLSDPPDAPPLGRYGTMHKEYLRREKPALYSLLLLSEKLYPLCREVDEAAAHRLATISDREVAHEIILSELVYCWQKTIVQYDERQNRQVKGKSKVTKSRINAVVSRN